MKYLKQLTKAEKEQFCISISNLYINYQISRVGLVEKWRDYIVYTANESKLFEQIKKIFLDSKLEDDQKIENFLECYRGFCDPTTPILEGRLFSKIAEICKTTFDIQNEEIITNSPKKIQRYLVPAGGPLPSAPWYIADKNQGFAKLLAQCCMDLPDKKILEQMEIDDKNKNFDL